MGKKRVHVGVDVNTDEVVKLGVEEPQFPFGLNPDKLSLDLLNKLSEDVLICRKVKDENPGLNDLDGLAIVLKLTSPGMRNLDVDQAFSPAYVAWLEISEFIQLAGRRLDLSGELNCDFTFDRILESCRRSHLPFTNLWYAYHLGGSRYSKEITIIEILEGVYIRIYNLLRPPTSVSEPFRSDTPMNNLLMFDDVIRHSVELDHRETLHQLSNLPSVIMSCLSTLKSFNNQGLQSDNTSNLGLTDLVDTSKKQSEPLTKLSNPLTHPLKVILEGMVYYYDNKENLSIRRLHEHLVNNLDYTNDVKTIRNDMPKLEVGGYVERPFKNNTYIRLPEMGRSLFPRPS